MKDIYFDIHKYPNANYHPHGSDAVSEFNSLLDGIGHALQIDVFKDKRPELFQYLKYVRIRVFSILEILREHSIYQRHVLDEIKFHFINDTSLNAFAATGNKYDHICITIGSILNVNTFFEVLLSHPKVLPEFGNPSEKGIGVRS